MRFYRVILILSNRYQSFEVLYKRNDEFKNFTTSMISNILNKLQFIKNAFGGSQNNLFKDSVIAFSMKIIGALLSFLITFYIASALGSEKMGVYFLSLAIVSICFVIARLGLDNIVVRRVAVADSHHESKTIKTLHSDCVKIITLSSFLLFLLLYVSSYFLANTVFNKPELELPLSVFSMAIVPFAISYFHGEMFRGLHKIAKSQFIQNVGVSLICILLLPIFMTNWGLYGAVIAYVLAALIVACMSFYVWKRTVDTLNVTLNIARVKQLLSESLPLLWVNLASIVTEWLPIILLGIWAGASDIGIYGIAMKIAMLTGLVLLAVNSAVAPSLAKYYKQNDIEKMKKTAFLSNKLMLLVSAPVIACIVLFPDFLMGIPGDEYVAGVSVLIVLGIGQFINVLTGSVGTILAMTGYEKVLWRNALIGAILCIVLCLILIPFLGALGAAIAVACTITFRNLAAVYYVNRYFNFNVLMPWKKIC